MKMSHWAISPGEVLQFLLAVVLLIILYSSPEGVNSALLWCSLFVFYGYFLRALFRPVYIRPGLPTYVSIEILFLIFYYLLFYLPYQRHLFGWSYLGDSAYFSNTYVEQSNNAVLAATVGLVAFCLGFHRVATDRRPRSTTEAPIGRRYEYRYLSLALLSLLLLSIGLYEISGWRSAGEGRYTGVTSGGVLAEGVYTIIIMLCMIATALAVARLVQRKWSDLFLYPVLVLVAYWSLRLLLEGDRNSFFLIAIVGAAGVTTFFFKASRVLLFLGLFVALALYHSVETIRATQDRSVGNLLSALTTESDSGGQRTSSFNITTTTLRASFDIVPNREEIGYGKYKLIGFLGTIPFVRGVIYQGETGFLATSKVLGRYMLKPNAQWGVGSNIISDIYMDFGTIGIPIGMGILGLVAGYIQRLAQKNWSSVKTIVLYLVAVALLAEIPRYTIDFPVRIMAWSALLLWLYDLFFHRFADTRSKFKLRNSVNANSAPFRESN